MLTRVNREKFLHCLENVQPGLSPRGIVQQSDAFIFKDGTVTTFNDEVACRMPSGLSKELSCAVPSVKLLEILRKLVEDELEVEEKDSELIVTGKSRQFGIRIEKDITLPVDTVEQPTEWIKLDDGFCEAINIVQQCVGRDESRFCLTCVHIHPEWLEACDGQQLCRWKLVTPIESSTLVRQSSIKSVVSLGMSEFNETKNWLHFRNSQGLILSCRRYVENYPDITSYLNVDGEPVTLPKSLGEATDKAAVFASENSDAQHVMVKLKPGKLEIKGTGITGWFREVKKLKYEGRGMEFLIAPQLLIDLVKRHTDCLISNNRLKVISGSYIYVSCLTNPNAETEAPGAEEEAVTVGSSELND